MYESRHKITRTDAVNDIAESVLDAVNKALRRHGKDPAIFMVLVSGLALAIRELGETNSLIIPVLRDTLGRAR
jgi:hypothetical protein